MLSFGIHVLFSKTKIDQKDLLLFPLASHDKIVRFEVPMDNPLLMNKLNNIDHLDGQSEHSDHTELVIAFFMQGIHRRTQQIHHHKILTKLTPVVVNLGQPDLLEIRLFHQPHVNLTLLKKLLFLQVNVFEFDGNLLSVQSVLGTPKLSKGSAANLDLNLVPIGKYLALH